MITWNEDQAELPERFTQHNWHRKNHMSKPALLATAVLCVIVAVLILVGVLAWRAW